MSQATVSTRLTQFATATFAIRTASSTAIFHDFPLGEKGVKQAHALGRYFARTPTRQIYSSPLERARQTAVIIASYLDSVPITYTDDLIETHFGLYLGRPAEQVPWRRALADPHGMAGSPQQ